MKIDLTKDQYRKLIEMLYLGNWIKNAQKLPADENYDHEADATYTHMKSFAKDFGSEDILRHDEEMDEYYLTQEKDFTLYDEVQDYESNVFWDEMVERLVERDFERLYTPEEAEKMSTEERLALLAEIEEKYDREFEENGIENLRILFE